MTDSRIMPSGAVIMSLFCPIKKLPPWMKTSTGKPSPGWVPLGRAMLRCRQSSEISVTFVKASGSNLWGCGHAGLYEVASTVELRGGTKRRGGLKRCAPPVSWPK